LRQGRFPRQSSGHPRCTISTAASDRSAAPEEGKRGVLLVGNLSQGRPYYKGARAEQAYPKLIHYNKLDKGGHFAAREQPAAFTSVMRASFKALWQFNVKRQTARLARAVCRIARNYLF
jgi:pimeloyl-ACP methyl ester carboxylesterase